MTRLELINILSSAENIKNVLVLSHNEIYDVTDVMFEDESAILKLNDN